jgi:DNA-binding Xre family transcriptional regulator
MTRLGEYLAKRSVNRAAISRKTGISTTRLNQLCNADAKLRADELYLIALSIDVDPGDLLDFICLGIELKNLE